MTITVTGHWNTRPENQGYKKVWIYRVKAIEGRYTVKREFEENTSMDEIWSKCTDAIADMALNDLNNAPFM